MSEYINKLKEYQDLSPQDTINLCKQLVPQVWQNYPNKHPEINRGVNVLQSPEALNCYMAAYGLMHLQKCRIALQNFPFENLERQVIEIIDWGCGQGLGTLCLIDALKQREMLTQQILKRVTLIEPSAIALERAKLNINYATKENLNLVPIQRYLPSTQDADNEIEGISYNCRNIIHIFSNILDIPTIHLEKLANLMTDDDSINNKRTHYILCIGPLLKTYRIDNFYRLFEKRGEVKLFSDISQPKTYQGFTCKTKCFIYDNGPLNLTCNLESQEANDCEQEDFDEINGEFKEDKINWHSYKDGKHKNLTTIQRNLAESIANKQQKISGVAGSGKTQVLATRAVNAQKRTSEYILILTYNKTLSNYLRFRINEVRADFDWNKIRIYNYHKFYRKQAKRCSPEQEFKSKDWVNFDKIIYDYDQDIFADKETPKYHAIFIDEVQDFKNEWLQIIHQHFLIPNGEFVVFGDPKQKIYDNQTLDKEGNINLGVIGGKWNQQLTKGHRFQSNGQLAKLASDFQRKFFPNIPIDKELFEGNLFLGAISYASVKANDDAITDTIIQIIQKHNWVVGETAILCNTKSNLCNIDHSYRQKTKQKTMTAFAPKDTKANDSDYKDNFTMFGDALKLSTIHSFKGWEAENIILILIPSEKQDSNSKGLVYTAITRAKSNLMIIDCDDSEYSAFFKSHSKPLQLN